MGLFSDAGQTEIPIVGGLFGGAETIFNGSFNLLNNLENAAGNLANGLGNMFNTPYFLIFLLLIGGFIAYRFVA